MHSYSYRNHTIKRHGTLNTGSAWLGSDRIGTTSTDCWDRNVSWFISQSATNNAATNWCAFSFRSVKIWFWPNSKRGVFLISAIDVWLKVMLNPLASLWLGVHMIANRPMQPFTFRYQCTNAFQRNKSDEKELKTESHAHIAHTHQQVTAVALNALNVNAKWYDNSAVPRIFNCIRHEANVRMKTKYRTKQKHQHQQRNKKIHTNKFTRRIQLLARHCNKNR